MNTKNIELKKNLSIKIVGIGGAGCNGVNNIIDHLENNISDDVVFVAMNTDIQSLECSKAHIKLQLGETGLGAGADPKVGEEFAIKSKDDIRNVLEGTDLIIINAGFGGGTGSGAASVVAEVAKEIGSLVIGIITKPFNFEGMSKKKIANDAVNKFKSHADVTVVIANQLLFRSVDGNAPLTSAFKYVDKVCSDTINCIIEIIKNNGIVNIDFADIRTTIANKGFGVVGTSFAEGENAAEIAAKGALSNPLLENTSVNGAENVLVHISGNNKLTLDDVESVLTTVQNSVGESTVIIYGAYINNNMHPKKEEALEDEKWINVFIIATGVRTEEKNDFYKNNSNQMTNNNLSKNTLEEENWINSKKEKNFTENHGDANSEEDTSGDKKGLFHILTDKFYKK